MERPYRPLSRETAVQKTLRLVAYHVTHTVLLPILGTLYGLRVKQRHRLRRIGPAVTVMNHCQYLEWFFLCHAAYPRSPRFSMEEANIRRKDIGWANRLMGGFGIPDDHPMAIAPVVETFLKNGELVHFFPEGELHYRRRIPRDFSSGAAWFACRHHVPLLPVAEVLKVRRISRLLRFWPPKTVIVVCDPLYPKDYEGMGSRLRDRAQAMTDDARKAIIRAIGQVSGLPEDD